MRIAAIVVLLLALSGCKSRLHGPVPIEANDNCASCRMAISERRYAAELVDQDGNVYKFDDIACMLRFAHSHESVSSAAEFYATDYKNEKNWLDARQSYFAELKTSVSSPMASGLVAFRNMEDARQVVGANLGKTMTFEELRKDAGLTEAQKETQPRP